MDIHQMKIGSQTHLNSMTANDHGWRADDTRDILLTFDWDLEKDAFLAVSPSPILGTAERNMASNGDSRHLLCKVDLHRMQNLAEKNREHIVEFLKAICTIHLPDGSNELGLANFAAIKSQNGRLDRMVGNVRKLSSDIVEEHQFNIATATTNDVVFLLDFQSNYHWWSSSFAENFGHRPLQGDDVLVQWKRLVHPDDLTRVEISHSKARKGSSETWQEEYRFLKADGSYAIVIDRARFFRDANGEILRSISSLIDVTALRESEERFQLATAAAADTLYTWDVHSNRAWRSESFYRKFGYKKEDFRGDPQKWASIIHESDRERVLRERDGHLKSSELYWEIVYRLKHKRGNYFNVVDRSFATRAADGSLLKISGSIVDVTELVREGERSRALAEVTGAAVFEYDVETETITISSGITSVFGHKWVGTFQTPSPWQEALHPEDGADVVRKFDIFALSNERYWNCSYRMARADGTWARVRERGIALRDEFGGMRRVIGTIEDVTLEYEAEEKLRHMEKLESVGKLTGGVAHDFNNLLTVITASAELLANLSETTTEQAVLVDAIKVAAARGADLTSSLLSFSRKKPLAPRSINVGSTIAELTDLLRRTLPAFVTLRNAVAPEVWNVEADPTQINTALLNLVLNASDAISFGGEIYIAAECVPASSVASEGIQELHNRDYVRIAVTDNGSGMTPDVLRKACDPFFTTKEIGRGSGLGLSMVWGFVQQSGGQMVVRSAVGEGTSVIMYLPRSISAGLTFKPQQADGGLIRGYGERVLVVEDDHMLRPQVVSMIRTLNYDVVAVESGEEAMRYVCENSGVDLIFTDLIMPGDVSGKDLADEVHRRFPEMRVLLTSGYADEAIVGPKLIDGSVNFLAKPYKLKDLSEKIAEVLGN